MSILRLFLSVFGEFQAPPIGLEYELKRVESFTVDPFGRQWSWNDAEEDEGKKDTCGHGLNPLIQFLWLTAGGGSEENKAKKGPEEDDC